MDCRCLSVFLSQPQITCCKYLSLVNPLGSFFSPEHFLMSNIFKFDSWQNSMGRSFKDLHNEISRNSSCPSLQMEGGSIDKLGHAENLSTLSDFNLVKSSGNFWIRWQLVTDNLSSEVKLHIFLENSFKSIQWSRLISTILGSFKTSSVSSRVIFPKPSHRHTYNFSKLSQDLQ